MKMSSFDYMLHTRLAVLRSGKQLFNRASTVASFHEIGNFNVDGFSLRDCSAGKHVHEWDERTESWFCSACMLPSDARLK